MNYRLDYDTQLNEVHRLTISNTALQEDVLAKQKLINALEQDIVVAHKTIESGQNIIRNFSQIKDKSKLVLSSLGNSNTTSQGKNELSDLFPSNPANELLSAAPTVYVGQDGASRLLHAITSQRDRYMKLHCDKEEEFQVLCSYMYQY